MAITTNTVLAALKTRLQTIAGATVVRTTSDPEEYWYDIAKASWPATSNNLIVIWDAESIIPNDEMSGGSRPGQEEMNIFIFSLIYDADGEQRDIEISNLSDSVKDALLADPQLSNNALQALIDRTEPMVEVSQPYAGSKLTANILYRRQA